MKLPLLTVIRDINNYFFLRSIIKKESQSKKWNKFNLRADWLGRIYTVINLPPEVTLSPDAPQEIRPAYIFEESRPINEYLTELNLLEVISPAFRPIDGSDSWVIIYNPVFQKLSFYWIFSRILLISILVWSQMKFSIFSIGWDKISHIISTIADFIKI